MHILGISCDYHDASAALVKDGQLVAAAAEERFSRRKHDPSLLERSIAWCLAHAGIEAGDLDYVAFYEKPLLKFDRIIATSLDYFPGAYPFFREALLTWLSQKLWIKARLVKYLGISSDKLLFCEHHLSHAASAFFCSGFADAAILTVDGIGEWATATLGAGRANSIHLTHEIRWPHSLGMLYSVFTAFLGFEVNEGEYKVMGMAPYGEPRYVDKIWKLLRVSTDGAIELDLDYFCYHRSPKYVFSPRFLALFGEPRPPDSHFFTRTSGYPSYFGSKPENFTDAQLANEHYADIAASLQLVTQQILVKMAKAALRQAKSSRLVMAGGVALNSVANGHIQDETGVDQLYVQPAAGDGGGALGAALWVWHVVLGRPQRFPLLHAYWGRENSDAEISSELMRCGVRAENLGSPEALVERAVSDLLAGKVLGWSQGRFEWGPRALGNRSILADPARAAMKEIVNTKIKFREPFRPFAPSLIAGAEDRYFVQPLGSQATAKFMLRTATVRPEVRDCIPAVTHVDGSARPHVVESSTNPLYHKLIQTFGDATGSPVVLNTSFNLRGEPMVASADDALATFFGSEMDVLYLGSFRVSK